MADVSVSGLLTGIEVAGVQGVELDGDLVRMTLFPVAGAKILDLVHKPTGADLLWKNPRVPLRRTYPGPNFDDVWCGGWDELFPTDPACTVGDTSFHDHGDLWFGPWEWEVVRDDGSEVELHLSRHTVALPCLMEKWITFRRDSPAIGFRHRLTNLGTQPVPYTCHQSLLQSRGHRGVRFARNRSLHHFIGQHGQRLPSVVAAASTRPRRSACCSARSRNCSRAR